MLLPRLMSKGDVLLVLLVSIIARIISDYNSILFKALMKWPSRFRLFPPLPPPTPPPISFSPLASSVPLFYVCTFLAIVQVHFNNDQLDNIMKMPGFQTLLKHWSRAQAWSLKKNRFLTLHSLVLGFFLCRIIDSV